MIIDTIHRRVTITALVGPKTSRCRRTVRIVADSRPRRWILSHILHDDTSFVALFETASNVVDAEHRARACGPAVDIDDQHARIVRVQLSDQTLSALNVRYTGLGEGKGDKHALLDQLFDSGLELSDTALRVQTLAYVVITHHEL